MTRAEFIERLKKLIEEAENDERTAGAVQNVPNDDLISRKAAIDVIDAVSPVDPMKSEYAQGIACGAALAKTYVEQLPSVQPERKKCKWEEVEVIPEAYDIAGVKTWASKMRCNQCGFATFAIEGRFAQYDFCPNCGSYNGGEQE